MVRGWGYPFDIFNILHLQKVTHLEGLIFIIEVFLKMVIF